MLKKINLLPLKILVFCCFLLAAFSIAAAGALELTVNDAIALALEHNLDFRIVSLDWHRAQLALQRAQIVGDQEMIGEAEKEWQKANKMYEEQRQNLINFVRNGYQEVLEREAAVANRLVVKERAEAQLRIDRSKYEAGLLSSLDIQRTENSLYNAEFSYETAIVNLETQRLQFNLLLGLDFEQELILTEQLSLDFLLFQFDLEECFRLALELDQGVLAAAEDLQKAEEKVLAAQNPFTPLVELEQALAIKEKALIHLEKAKHTLYFMIRADYYNLNAWAHSVRSKEQEIEFERKTLQAEESKYQAGVISNAQIVAQQEKLALAEQEYGDALLQYSLHRVKLLQSIGKAEIFWGEADEN